jgi:SAM-dependent methyltransferase
MRIIEKRFQLVNSTYREKCKLSNDDLRRIKAVQSVFPKQKIDIFLDIGCFDGTISALVKPDGAYAVGLELSREAARRAKKRLDDVIICDVEESLPLKNDTCDLIFAGEIIEHLFDPDYFLDEVKRILKPGEN